MSLFGNAENPRRVSGGCQWCTRQGACARAAWPASTRSGARASGASRPVPPCRGAARCVMSCYVYCPGGEAEAARAGVRVRVVLQPSQAGRGRRVGRQPRRGLSGCFRLAPHCPARRRSRRRSSSRITRSSRRGRTSGLGAGSGRRAVKCEGGAICAREVEWTPSPVVVSMGDFAALPPVKDA